MGWAIETAQHEDIQGNTNIQGHRGSGASRQERYEWGAEIEASLLKTNIVEYFQVEGKVHCVIQLSIEIMQEKR